MTEDELIVVRPSASRSVSRDDKSAGGPPAGGVMSPAEETYFVQAYSATEMRTFHCERVRKMPLSGLDPSMLTEIVTRVH